MFTFIVKCSNGAEYDELKEVLEGFDYPFEVKYGDAEPPPRVISKKKEPAYHRPRRIGIADVREILRLEAPGVTKAAIARKVGLSGTTVGRVLSGDHPLLPEYLKSLRNS